MNTCNKEDKIAQIMGTLSALLPFIRLLGYNGAIEVTLRGAVMKLISIISSQGKRYYDAVKSLYMDAFPAEERKPFEKMEELEAEGRMELLALTEQEELLGLVFYLITPETAILDYFAILPEKRGMGYGGKAVAAVLERFSDRKLIFEIEQQDPAAENALERKRRKEFYLRNGLKETGIFVHVYHTDFELLTPDGELTYETYVTMLRESMGDQVVQMLAPRRNPRPMRLKKRQVSDRQQLEEILKSCSVIRIAYQDQEGLGLVPMNFGYRWTKEYGLQFYLHSAKSGRKVQAFAASPQIAFEMDCDHQLIKDQYVCEYSYAYSSITGVGKISLVEEEEEKKLGLKLIVQHLDPETESRMLSEMVQAVNVYRIDADYFTGKERRARKVPG